MVGAFLTERGKNFPANISVTFRFAAVLSPKCHSRIPMLLGKSRIVSWKFKNLDSPGKYPDTS